MDKLIIGTIKLDTLVAISNEEHEYGLMFKPWPPPILSFPYYTSEIRKFWMKNTISPLDIIFCNNGEVIDVCNGTPLSVDLIGPDQPSDLVIEFPRGLTKHNNICVGDPVRLQYSIKTISKKFKNYF